MLIAIERKQQSPAAKARDAYQAAIYRDHPYAYPSDGTRESIPSLGRADIVNFHKDFYNARNVRLIIVGDLDRKQAAALAGELTADLAHGRVPEPLPAVEQLEQGDKIRIEHPSSQVHILLGQPGLKRGDPDYFPLYVGNHILGGGGFVSRLYEEIREKRGLSYGAYSYFAPRREAGPFTASPADPGRAGRAGLAGYARDHPLVYRAGADPGRTGSGKKEHQRRFPPAPGQQQ